MGRDILLFFLCDILYHDFTFKYSCCEQYRKIRVDMPVVQHKLMDAVRYVIEKEYCDVKQFLQKATGEIDCTKIIQALGKEEKILLSEYVVKKILK